MTMIYGQTSETNIVSSYLRANQVIASNPLNGLPHIVFHEEKVITDQNNVVTTEPTNRKLSLPYTPGQTFDLLNPADGSKIGTFTSDQVLAMLFSLYISTAQDADAAAVNP